MNKGDRIFSLAAIKKRLGLHGRRRKPALSSISLSVEGVEQRVVMSSTSSTVMAAAQRRPLTQNQDQDRVALASPTAIKASNVSEDASFIDPTTRIQNRGRVSIGNKVFIGPFAQIAAIGRVRIGDSSNVQDNVMLYAGSGRSIEIGDGAILAHNAIVLGNSKIGAEHGSPAFVGFNAIIDNATVEPGAMVSSLARVAPGVTIPAGFKVLPGKFITTAEEASNPALGKVSAVTDADREFMNGVLHVNESFAQTYAKLAQKFPKLVRGIGPDPGNSDFNPNSDKPTLDGRKTLASTFRNRIIGAVRLTDTLKRLSKVLGSHDSIRADEGEPFEIGAITKFGNRVTFHALEHTGITVGGRLKIGNRVVVHGGQDDGNNPQETTRLGNRITIGNFAVVFRSTIGDNVQIGDFAYVDGSQIADGTVIQRGAIIINNQNLGTIEWI